MWYFSVVTSSRCCLKERLQKEVRGPKPSDVGSVLAKFSVGDVVHAKWRDGNVYGARIKKNETIYHVQYLEDDIQSKVSQTDIEL